MQRSSTEVEGTTEGLKESIYLQRFFEEIGCEQFETITLFKYNMGALKLVRTQHSTEEVNISIYDIILSGAVFKKN